MDTIFRLVLSMTALAMLTLAGGPARAHPVAADGEQPAGCILTADPDDFRTKLAVVDLAAAEGRKSQRAAGLSQQLRDTLKYMPEFQLIDPADFPEAGPAAGPDGTASPDYQAWMKIGTDFLIQVKLGEAAGLDFETQLFKITADPRTAGLESILTKRYQGPADEAPALINQCANDLVRAMTGTPGLFGTKIIFVAGEGKKKSVMMTEFGSGRVERVSDPKVGEVAWPSLGPGGRTTWVQQKGGQWELMVDGKAVAADRSIQTPAFRPDGTVAAALAEDQRTAIYTFSDQGEKTFLTGSWGHNTSPAFAPNGSRMAFVSDRDGRPAVFAAAADGSLSIRLTNVGLATDPAWSPDGRFITLVSRDTAVAAIRPDGTGFQHLTDGHDHYRRPGFSPDGRMIVFASDRDGGQWRLYVISVNGGGPRLLLPDYKPAQDQPHWSPDLPD